MDHPERQPAMQADKPKTRSRELLALLILILIALGLRLGRLSFQPLWWDEGWSLYFATTDPRTLLGLTAVDIHPPFYYLLLKVWIEILGPSPLSVRLLSVLTGTTTVPLIYLVGRQLLGRKGGLVAALLLTFSPLHIYYSQEVRMYGLVTLLGLAALYSALRWQPRGWGAGLWVGYVLAAAAALYTQYYAAFLLLALNLVVLIRWLQSRFSFKEIRSWLGAQLAVLLLFLPWLWYAGDRLITYVRFKVSVEKDLSLDLLTYLGRHVSAFDWGHAEGTLAGWWWFGLLPAAVLVLAFIPPLWRRSRIGREHSGDSGSRLGPWAWSLAICASMLCCGFVVNLIFPFNPPRSERLLLLALPAYLLLFAAALVSLWRHRRWLASVPAAALVITGLLSLFFFYTTPRYPDDDYRPIASRVRALSLPSDAIINIHPWQVGYFQSYLPNDETRPALVLTPRQVLPRERQLWADDPALMTADLDALLAKHERLWFPDHRTMGRGLEGQVESYLVGHAYPVLSEWYGESTVLSLFATGESQVQPVAARFGEWLALDSAALNATPIQAGWGIVSADLTWRLVERPGERYQVVLHLEDQTGRVWAQRDSSPTGGLEHFFEWPVGEAQLDRHGLLVPAGTPPGAYRVTLSVYRSQDLEVLPVAFEGGSGGQVTLGTVKIIRPQTAPPLEALAIEQPLQAEFGDRLRLLGVNVKSGPALRPGESVEVEILWQALADPDEDFLPRLQLLDSDGTDLAETMEKPVEGNYPTAWWRSGELVRDPHALPIPATVPAGGYHLALSLIRAADGAPTKLRTGQIAVNLAEIEVVGREHRYEPTTPNHPEATQLDPTLELIGYDLREVVRAPGSPLEVTLHWHALQTPGKNYHTFVHLLDTSDNIVAQHDGPPGEGELPALGWLPGEYLVDVHLLSLPFDLPDGDYRLRVGLYDPVTSQRPGEPILLNALVPVKANEGCQCR